LFSGLRHRFIHKDQISHPERSRATLNTPMLARHWRRGLGEAQRKAGRVYVFGHFVESGERFLKNC
jgi:hypothetical protein